MNNDWISVTGDIAKAKAGDGYLVLITFIHQDSRQVRFMVEFSRQGDQLIPEREILQAITAAGEQVPNELTAHSNDESLAPLLGESGTVRDFNDSSIAALTLFAQVKIMEVNRFVNLSEAYRTLAES